MLRSRKEYLHYVCAKCLRPLPRCSCASYPPDELIYLDKALQEGVILLRDSGWLKDFVHQNGEDGCEWTLRFQRRLPFSSLENLPEGTWWENGSMYCRISEESDANAPLPSKRLESAFTAWAKQLIEEKK